MSAISMFQNKNKKQEAKELTSVMSARKHLRTAAKASKWVGKLPLTDIGETTRQLYVGLVGLNKEPLAPQVRIDVTEILLPYVKMSLDHLARHFQNRSFPLPERTQKILDLKQAMLMELAGSYQLAALDMITKGSLSKKKILLSIGRAIKYMSLVLMNGYEVYVKHQKNIWHDIHHLYLIACENNIQKKEIPDNGDTDGENFTIEDHYKLINLVALSGPNGARQGEIARIIDFFKQYIHEIAILTDFSKVKSKYAHIALLNSDEPAALMPVSEMVNSPTSRLFDLTSAIRSLDDFVSESEESDLGLNNKLPMMTHSLAKRLVYALTTIRNRRFKRFPRDEKATIVIRMNDVIEILRGTQSDSFVDQINEDVEDDNIYTELSATEEIESPWSAVDIDDLDTDRDVQIHTWHIDNSSTGGYGLSQVSNSSSTARVGEMVAIKDPKDNQDLWQIAVIRWMDYISKKGLCMGLEMLSQRGMTVLAEEVTNRELTQTFPVEGIYLPEIDGAREQANIVFPGYIFQSDDVVTINLSDRQELIKITTVDDTLGSFAYCAFEKMEKEDNPKDEIEVFDDVWEFL